jgi:hypothetical protein
MVGQAFARHERLLIALGVGAVVAIVAWLVGHHFASRERAKEDRAGP